MSKELLENLLIEFDEMGFEPTILCDSKKEIDSFRNRLKQVLDYFKSIDNANPSEALECLEELSKEEVLFKNRNTIYMSGEKSNSFTHKDTIGNYFKGIENIKQALLKQQEQENKKYLKWEDLEFGVTTSLPTTIKVKMGDTQYRLCLRTSFSDVKSVVLRDTDLKPILHIYEKEKQLFNDLHLERVEE